MTMSLLSKVNLQKKADKLFPSGRVWKLWTDFQGDFNPDASIAETKLELALSKLKLMNKKNPRKLLEDIALCENKYMEYQSVMERKSQTLFASEEINMEL